MSSVEPQSVETSSGSPFAMLFAPAKGAEAAARSGPWFPLLALAVAAAAAEYPMLFRFGNAGTIDAWLQYRPHGATPVTIGFFLVSQYGAPLLLPLAALASGFAMNLAVVFFLDARVKRTQVLGVVAWAFLPLALERLFVAAVHAAGPGPDSNPFNPLASNAGFFLDATEASTFWYRFASGLDVFSAWTVVIASLAAASLGRRSATTVLVIFSIVWLFALVVKAWVLA